ncbi:MAG: hypothetical protein QOJ64_130 [Acidobacteriota bacterium]|jgi:hypothetical protein|nr:hypothetical protein [Acidobacteriota bacterium]
MKSKPLNSQAKLNVLFIGNSFTARNDLPALIAQLASARGGKLEHKLISAGGASLRMHWNKGDAQKEIATKRYDYVVLQEQSTLPVKNAKRMHENIRLFDDVIKKGGARTVLYMTWARRHEPQNQKLITDAYTSIGVELGALVVPVGEAWRAFLAKHKTPALHDADNSHPSLAGSYLAACVFFSVLYKESPVGIGIPIKGLSAEDVVALQKIA